MSPIKSQKSHNRLYKTKIPDGMEGSSKSKIKCMNEGPEQLYTGEGTEFTHLAPHMVPKVLPGVIPESKVRSNP